MSTCETCDTASASFCKFGCSWHMCQKCLLLRQTIRLIHMNKTTFDWACEKCIRKQCGRQFSTHPDYIEIFGNVEKTVDNSWLDPVFHNCPMCYGIYSRCKFGPSNGCWKMLCLNCNGGQVSSYVGDVLPTEIGCSSDFKCENHTNIIISQDKNHWSCRGCVVAYFGQRYKKTSRLSRIYRSKPKI